MEINNKPYSIIFDETQDIATIEQAALIIGNFYEGNIKERFISCNECAETTAEILEAIILKKLESLGSSPNRIVGQSYD